MFTVNGKAKLVNPLSLVNCDVLMVDVANEYVLPFVPTPRNPDDRELRFSVPTLATVVDEVTNDE